MCGIFGYVGNKEASPILLAALRALEYRGYDSAGLYIPELGTVKAVGPVEELAKKLEGIKNQSTAGIAHTRWATHGAPSEVNAHPHRDHSGTIWLVHNGIIENYRELRDSLIEKGCTFESETDTEVLAKLVGSHYRGSLSEALTQALLEVQGTYGIAVMDQNNPNRIVVARMGSPIILGKGEGAYFVSSDTSALLPHTKEVTYLEDGDIAVVTGTSCIITNVRGESPKRKLHTVEWDIESVQKAGYDHFLLKEIMDVPEAIENTLRGRLVYESADVKLGGLEPVLETLETLDRLGVVGCGSAYYAGLIGKMLLETYAGLPVDIEIASEYRYRSHPQHGKTALLAISQSGETADTLACVRKAKENEMLTLGIVNVVGSTITRETDAGVHNHAGPEISIASTKAFISQVVVLMLMTILIGKRRGMPQRDRQALVHALTELPAMARKTLLLKDQIAELAQIYATYTNAMFIGRTTHAPIAYEGALKLKEVTYIHAEGYAGGELKHGPIALLDPSFPVIALAPQNDVYEKIISNIEEVKARGARVLAIATEGDTHIKNVADDVIFVPKVHESIEPVISLIPLQLLAYYVGVAKGLNVDRPRNLAKAVTVE